jgi:hypothetical protein
MPLCTCGCNQELTRRAIKNHLQGRAIPHLVTAAVKTRHALSSTVSPPRLNPRKKLRSSRRYFPSSPTSVVSIDEPDFHTSEGDDAVRDGESCMEYEERFSDGDAAIQCAINAALKDVWSGLHHSDGDTVEEDDDDAVEEGDDGGAKGGGDKEDNCADDSWKLYDDLSVGENGLSALDMIGEDFERNVTANGELSMAVTFLYRLTVHYSGELN